MTFLDLFAGIGGFRRGMELAGHKCVGFCEWDKYARMSYISMHCITDEQRKHLELLGLKKRQKEILKSEYLNGEWCSTDIRTVDASNIPKADCWCFGAPCQDFSIAGKRAGLEGDRSALVREVFRILREIREEDRPEWLIYENVKGMLSSNRGFDFLSILLEMDVGGYDIEWQLLNSKLHGVPQNRERVYTVGHLRARGCRKIFPLKAADGKNNSKGIIIVANRQGYRRNMQTFDPDGITETLSTCSGGGREHHVALPLFGIDYNVRGEERAIANTVKARYDAGVTNFKQDGTAVCIRVLNEQIIHDFNDENKKTEHDDIYVEITPHCHAYAVWYEKYQCYIAIRKLTPKECFRLQGWTDDYFEKAQFVNSNSQLYKQAGNGVTVNVVYDIAQKMETQEA